VAPADAVENAGLPLLVACGPEQIESLSAVMEGIGVASLVSAHDAETFVGPGLHGEVVGLTE
jgi:hypothetical protein